MADEVKYAKILVPTDGSNSAFLAGKHAVYLAKKLGAGVLALNVVDSDLAFHSGLHYADEVSQLEKSGIEATARIKKLCEDAGVPSEEIMAKGSPAQNDPGSRPGPAGGPDRDGHGGHVGGRARTAGERVG